MQHLNRQTIVRCAWALAALCATGSPWCAERADASDSVASHNVEVIVSRSLYSSGQITPALNQYLADLQAQGYVPTLTTTSFSDPAALRSHLANRHGTQGLAGAVLIGDLPVEYFERGGLSGNPEDYERFPNDLYYMDLDGVWSDTDSNGTYDAHGKNGNAAPEIWVGRMTTSSLSGLHEGRTEAGLLNDYFQKNHQYRQGLISLPDVGLAYIDDDWRVLANSWAADLGLSVGGNVEIVKSATTTTASDYMNRLDPNSASGYESVLLAAHSDVTYHAFRNDGDWSWVLNTDLNALGPQAFFYNFYTCFNANYEVDGYMAGEYVFGAGRGLLAVGSTNDGGMLDFADYYQPLGEGKTFGEAFLDWWLARAEGGFQPSEIDRYYGMTMLGDPLLVTQNYRSALVPEPSTIALLAVGLLSALLLLRCRSRGRK